MEPGRPSSGWQGRWAEAPGRAEWRRARSQSMMYCPKFRFGQAVVHVVHAHVVDARRDAHVEARVIQAGEHAARHQERQRRGHVHLLAPQGQTAGGGMAAQLLPEQVELVAAI